MSSNPALTNKVAKAFGDITSENFIASPNSGSGSGFVDERFIGEILELCSSEIDEELSSLIYPKMFDEVRKLNFSTDDPKRIDVHNTRCSPSMSKGEISYLHTRAILSTPQQMGFSSKYHCEIIFIIDNKQTKKQGKYCYKVTAKLYESKMC